MPQTNRRFFEFVTVHRPELPGGAAGFEFELLLVLDRPHSIPTIVNMSESTPTASRGSSISQRLRATKKILQDVTFGAKCV